LPLIASDCAARAARGITHSHPVGAILRVCDGVSHVSAIRQRGLENFLNWFEVAAHQSANRTAIGFARNGHIGAKRIFSIRHVELPSHPEERETLFKEESIAEILRDLRIGTTGGEVEDRRHALVTAIRYFIQ